MTLNIQCFLNKGISFAAFIKHFNKLYDATFAVEDFRVCFAVLSFFTKIINGDVNFLIQIRELTQTTFKNIFIISCSLKNSSIGPEMNCGPVFIRRANFSYSIQRNTRMIFLLK